MTLDEKYQLAWTRLHHVLSFFDRVDTKLSVVLGVNVAMLGVIATQADEIHRISALGWLALIVYGVCSAWSFVCLYRGSFPQLSGGSGSLIYFAQIAARPPETFTGELFAQSEEARLADVVEQLRVNSSIVTTKYSCLCRAYRLMAISLIPWATALVIFELQ